MGTRRITDQLNSAKNLEAQSQTSGRKWVFPFANVSRSVVKRKRLLFPKK